MQLISYRVSGATTSVQVCSETVRKSVSLTSDTDVMPVEIVEAAEHLFRHLCRTYSLVAWDCAIRRTDHPQLGIQFHFTYTHLENELQHARTTIKNVPNLEEMSVRWRRLQNQVAEHYLRMLKMTDLQLALAL